MFIEINEIISVCSFTLNYCKSNLPVSQPLSVFNCLLEMIYQALNGRL